MAAGPPPPSTVTPTWPWPKTGHKSPTTTPTSARQNETSWPPARRYETAAFAEDSSLILLLVLSLIGGGIALYQSHSTPPQRSTITVLAGHTAAVTSVTFSRDGHIMASGSDDMTVRLWHFP